MAFEPEVSSQAATRSVDFVEPDGRKPLILLRDTERALRLRAVETLAPVLSDRTLEKLDAASQVADESLDQLADIDLEQISDRELRPARIQVGLAFVGFGALMLAFLLLYFSSLHPELSVSDQLHRYWYQYIWFVSVGISGMFMLGREAMRPKQ